VRDVLDLLGPTRTASTTTLAAAASQRSVGRWIASGRLVRLHPGWVTTPEFAEDWTVRAHAATGYAGGPLSHISALAAHGVVDNEVTRLNVTVTGQRKVRTSRWLRVHRSRTRFSVGRARDLPVTTVVRSLVDTWGGAHREGAMRGFDSVVRGAVLRATRERRLSGAELLRELGLRPELPGRRAFGNLIDPIEGGCQSELEIFGVRHVLDIPGLPPCRQQHRLVLPDGPVFLDAAWPEVRLAIELDGAAFHGTPEDRERDLRRDAAMAALGWIVLRFSYRRLTRHPEACRAQIRAAYLARSGVAP
jgi:REase_MTES_1575